MKTHPWLTLSLLLLALAPAGCRRPGTAPAQVYVAPGAPFRICRPEDGPDLFADQEIRFQFPDGRQETALAVVQNRGGELALVASTPMGQTLFTVRVKGDRVAVDARIPIPGDLDLRVLAALVQFALWPADAVRAALGPGVTLAEAGSRRTLLRKGRPVWIVDREGDAPPYRGLVLQNPAMGFTVRIRTLES